MDTPSASTPPLLQMSGICKRFPGVIALRDADFDLQRGEVHVLMGANGAGKSTLMKVLSGVYAMDSGTVRLDGEEIELGTSRNAQKHGIAIIHQHFSQVLHLSVAENIFLGREPLVHGMIDRKRLRRDAEAALAEIGLEVDVGAKVIDLSVSQRQMVEIAKALTFNSKILIMDEPTSALTKKETERLFKIIEDLKRRRIGIVYISHRLEELGDLGTRVTVMRDGQVVGTRPIAGTPISELVRMMAGKDVKLDVRKDVFDSSAASLREVLRVENLCSGNKLHDISFSLYEGEILGLFGLMGSGRTELARAIFGVDPFDSGRILLSGEEVRINSPRAAVRRGLGFLTEDRLHSGLAMTMGVGHNLTLPCLDKYSRAGCIGLGRERVAAGGVIRDLNIKTPNQSQFVRYLSGGNQQKVVIGKWILAGSGILILDDPTQGIDVEAKGEVYALIVDITRRQKKSVLLISSEMPEIIGLSDRILCIREGRIVAAVMPRDATQETLMAAALAGKAV